jgi:hypothetical protein
MGGDGLGALCSLRNVIRSLAKERDDWMLKCEAAQAELASLRMVGGPCPQAVREGRHTLERTTMDSGVRMDMCQIARWDGYV